MIADVDNCKSMLTGVGDSKLMSITNDFVRDLVSMGVANGSFVLLVGVILNFFAVSFSLLASYNCGRMFGKCQHRGWRVLNCVGFPVGFCAMFIAGPAVGYSIYIGVEFYPFTQQEFKIPGCLRIHYYSTFIFLLITRGDSSYASRRSRTRDTVKLTVLCVCVCVCVCLCVCLFQL